MSTEAWRMGHVTYMEYTDEIYACELCGSSSDEGATCPACDRCVECSLAVFGKRLRGVLCEDAPGWCGNCGNCTTHCQNTEACHEWSRNLEALAAGFYGFDSTDQLD